MPPEQARGQVKAMGPASDVYGLGAVLYCLLTGRPPFQSSDPVQTMKQVCENEPVPPRRLNAQVPHDLETICLKCLQKELARRYPSATEVADDLGRYERGEPVRARPVGRPERLWRWCRRNPAVAGMLAALVVIIFGSLGGLTALYLHADRQRQAAEHQRQAAEQRETEVRAVTRFYEDHVLAAARPKGWAGGAGRNMTLKQALDQATTDIDKAFAGQPELEASVRNTLGMTYWHLGQFAAANPHLKRAYEIRLERLGIDHPDTLASLHNLAMQRWKQGKAKDAAEIARLALDARRRVLGTEHEETLWTQLWLGLLLSEAGQQDESGLVLRQAVDACKRSLGPDHHHTLHGQHDLARHLFSKGKTEEALDLIRLTFEGRRRSLGPDHPETLRSQGVLARFLVDQSKFEEAEPLCRQCLERRRHVLGPDHFETLWSEWYLAILLNRKGQYAEAEKLSSHTLERSSRVLGRTHPDTLNYMVVLGEVLCNAGRPAQAEPLLRECLKLCEKALSPGQAEIAYTRCVLGQSLAKQGKFAEAEMPLLTGYQELMNAKNRPVWDVRWADNSLAWIIELYEKWGKVDQTEAWRKKRLASRQ
jgi:tetratricopeptide (TPR) repeat protein